MAVIYIHPCFSKTILELIHPGEIKIAWGNLPIYFPPSPSFPSLRFLFPFPQSLPLEAGPLNAARGLGRESAASSPIGIWGRAPAEIEFSAL